MVESPEDLKLLAANAPNLSTNDSITGKTTENKEEESKESDIDESKSIEEQQGSQKPIIPRLPTPFDVLFGRGKPYQGHAGNIRLRKVVDLYKVQYTQARHYTKSEIAEEIVQFVKNGDVKAGRFLKRVEGDDSWAEVSDSMARDKVSHLLSGKPRRKEKTPAKSQHVIDELSSLKRPSETGKISPEQVKRINLAKDNTSNLDFLEGQRRSNSMIAPPALASSELRRSAAVASSTLPIDLHPPQLLNLALPEERQLGGLGYAVSRSAMPWLPSQQGAFLSTSSGDSIFASSQHQVPGEGMYASLFLDLLRAEKLFGGAVLQT
jgi:hypothetical protein